MLDGFILKIIVLLNQTWNEMSLDNNLFNIIIMQIFVMKGIIN